MIRLLLLATLAFLYRCVLCGRFNLTKPKEIQERFGFVDWHERRIEPRFNIAPSQEIITIVQRPGEPPTLLDAKWGLVPFWAKPQPGPRKPPPINARAESLHNSPMFRIPLVESRCLILATGFYEWRNAGGNKVPMHIRLKDGQPFAFAGLWARGRHGAQPTALIVTTKPNELVSSIHNRMPAILRPEDELRWLDPSSTDPNELQRLLEPLPADIMEAYQVAPLVNSFKNEAPELILPVQAQADPDSASAATHTVVQIPFPHV